MKKIKNNLKTVLIFLILISFYSFSKFEISDSIKIIKRNNTTYMYLTQSLNFSLNKVTINENCKPQLHLIVHYLKKYPKLQIEIGVHNDLRTKEDLSQTRADILKGFLENYGANSENITAVGYGSSNLLYDCRGKNNKCTEKEQQANRRIEIKILNPTILKDYIIINNKMGAIVVKDDRKEKTSKVEIKDVVKSEEKKIAKKESED